jgi:hypothetical protein
MLINLYLAQILIVLAAVGAAISALPEGRRKPFPRWRLLVAPVLASLAAFLQVIYPSLRELDQPEMWELTVLAGVAGIARGQFMTVEVDQIWNLIRVPRPRELLPIAMALPLLAFAGAAEAVLVEFPRDPESPGLRILIEIGMAMAAGFLVGRAGAVWFRFPHVPHQELAQEES